MSEKDEWERAEMWRHQATDLTYREHTAKVKIEALEKRIKELEGTESRSRIEELERELGSVINHFARFWWLAENEMPALKAELEKVGDHAVQVLKTDFPASPDLKPPFHASDIYILTRHLPLFEWVAALEAENERLKR